MKNSGMWRDISLLSMTLPFGILLQWALSHQRLDELMTLLVLAIPVTGLILIAAQWPKTGTDEF